MPQDKKDSQTASSFQVSDQLAAIARANPGISLSAADVRNANNGTLVLVGVGSILPVGPAGNFGIGGSVGVRRGCIEYMRYQTGSEDLREIRMDGAGYGGENVNDFREILEKAAFHMKCINFCWNKETHRMTMLNVYPQCCCRCEEVKT